MSTKIEAMSMTLHNWIKSHQKWLMRAFYVVMLIAVALVAHNEVASLSHDQLQSLFQAQRPDVLIGVAALGVFAFTATGLYDVFARKHFQIDVPVHTAMTIGWIAQAFNNFAGLGGLTGGTLRTKHYTTRGVNSKSALALTMAVWAANLLGLFVLLLITLPAALHWEGKALIVPLVACIYLPIYFFGQNLKLGKVDLSRTFLAQQTGVQKLQMLLASVIDWLAAGVFFWLCLYLFSPEISLFAAIFVYATATIVGLLSMLPAGIGTFDLAVLTMLTTGPVQHAQAEQIVLGVVLFRITYYLVPWLLALMLCASEFLDARSELHVEQRRGGIVKHVLWLGTLLCGVALVLSTFVPEKIIVTLRLNAIIPASIRETSSFTSLLLGIALMALAFGLMQGVRRVYLMALAVLLTGAVSALLQGLDFHEAALLCVFATLLFLARQRFDAEPLAPTLGNVAAGVAIVMGIPVALFFLRNRSASAASSFYHHTFSTSSGLAQFLLYTFVTAVVVTSLMFARSKKLEFSAPSEAEVEQFSDFLLTHEGNNYSYLFALGDKQVFYNESHTVAFLYRPHKGNLLVLGDPLGCEPDVPEALDELLHFAKLHRMGLAFYQISSHYLPMLVEQGLQVVKIGEDATVELDSYSNVGNSGKVFRRMRNRMAQNGTRFELLFPPFDTGVLEELREVSQEWLGDREEMGYSLGFFDDNYLSSGPIAVVRSEARIEGFANVVFYNSEAVSFDLMRFRPDAPGGTMDAIMVSLIEWAKETGFKEFNIGMAPLSNVGRKAYSHGAEIVVRYVHDFGDRIYNFHGLRAYKEKFKPRWDSRYLVYSSKKSLPSLLLSLLEIVNRPVHHQRDDCAASREQFAAYRNEIVSTMLPIGASSTTNREVLVKVEV